MLQKIPQLNSEDIRPADINPEPKICSNAVLIVEDNPVMLHALNNLLRKQYTVFTAVTGADAFRLAQEKQPDLILLDIMLPDTSGFELCQELKKNDHTSPIPVIFLTANADEENVVKAFEVGGVDYVTKPFRVKELLARIKTQIELNNSKKRLRQVIDLVPHRLFAKDTAGNIVLANNAAASFFSSHVDDMLGKPEPELPEGFVYESVQGTGLENINTSDTALHSFEERLIKPNGKNKYFQTHILPFTFSGTSLPALLQIAIDVTSLKEKQEEINRLNQQLLQQSSYKDKLLSIIAHDLVNLIFSNELLLTSIIRKSVTSSKEDILQQVDKARVNSKETLSLLNNLLMWSMAQFEALSFNPIALLLSRELQKLSGHLQQQATAKGIKLEIMTDEDLYVKADPNMLQTILRNLVSNAIKFSESERTVTVSAIRKGRRVYLSVTDQGVGMNRAMINKLLCCTKDITSTFGTKGEQGSGIGLNLSRDFIEQHGGKLQIKSKPGQGSTFTFSVPLAHGN